MSNRVNKLIRACLGTEVRLQACLARLRANTDGEALHDLRIALRRLRSLLRPLREVEVVAAVDRAAAALGRLSSPLRDLEVMLAELERRDRSELLAARRLRWREGVATLLVAPQLWELQRALEDFPAELREQQRAGQLKALDKRIRRYLPKQERALRKALADPAHDRHRLRLLIKRLRYAAEVYPQLSPLDARLPVRLKLAQAALGDWHDRWQWLLRAADEAELAAMEATWREELVQTEKLADQALEQLRQCCRHSAG